MYVWKNVRKLSDIREKVKQGVVECKCSICGVYETELNRVFNYRDKYIELSERCKLLCSNY